MNDTDHDAIKPDGNVSIRAGGIHVSLPAAVVGILLTAIGTAGATRVIAPDPSSETRAQTTAVESLARELAGMKLELKVLTETVNRNADAAANRDTQQDSRMDRLAERKQ